MARIKTGLDIGRDYAKIVQLIHQRDAVNIANIGKVKVDIPDDESDEARENALIETLRRYFKDNKLKIIKTEGWGYLAFPFGFPDIMPSLRFMPYFLFRILFFIDSILSKIPFIKRLSWHTIVLAEKE